MTNNTPRPPSENALPRVVSLFSGAMGLDIGLQKAGFRTCVAVESDPIAVDTIRTNCPQLPVIDKPIEETSTDKILEAAHADVGELELIVGGPACQSFSTAGKRRSVGEPDGRLFFEFMRIVDHARPQFFLIENVRGMLSAAVKHRPLLERAGNHPPLIRDEELGSAFEQITQRLRKSRYYVVFDVLNAADFGVAQTRQRLVMIGSREGIPIRMPNPSHSKTGASGLPHWQTLRQCLCNLQDGEPEYIDFAPSQRDFFAYIPEGGNWKDLPESKKEVALGGAIKSWGGRSGFFRRLSWDRPSPTLNTDPGAKATSLCHPDQLRPLSVREYARIQGFPDTWKICGSTRAKYRQLGNAVPVQLAATIGTSILKYCGKRGVKLRLGKVECHNLDLLTALSARPTTRLNPPRMRAYQAPTETREWRGNRPSIRNQAVQYTPAYLVGAVGKKKIAKKIVNQLVNHYGSPDLGNFADPIEELFFIILSQQTTGPNYERVYAKFRRWIGDWELLPKRDLKEVASIIEEAGLSQQKAAHFIGAAETLYKKFGRVTLDPLIGLPDAEVQAFLTSLPGVGNKTAKCVMLFSMGRQVLPVDTHVARIAERVGIVAPSSSKSLTHEVLEAVVPPELRYDFHVNAVAHGRVLCRAKQPLCGACPIRPLCQHWRSSSPQ